MITKNRFQTRHAGESILYHYNCMHLVVESFPLYMKPAVALYFRSTSFSLSFFSLSIQIIYTSFFNILFFNSIFYFKNIFSIISR